MLFVAPVQAERMVENFNRDWKFAKGPQPGAKAVDFDDDAWQSVRLPHDWAIAGPYDPQGNPHTGKLPWKGEGWYRKQFELRVVDAGKRVYLDFDGVMAMPTVYINGEKAGGWDYGYMSFRVDATEFVRFDRPNVVAVHVDTRPHHSRWYPGAGIYREVQLVINDSVHVAHWGTFVTTPEVTDASANVRVQTTVENHNSEERLVELESTVLDPEGNVAAMERKSSSVSANEAHEFDQSFTVSDPRRWDIENPVLYKIRSRVLVACNS